MKMSKWILLSASVAAAMAGFVLLTGCEDKPSTDVAGLNYTSDSHSDVFSDQIQSDLAIDPGGYTFTSTSTNSVSPNLRGLQVNFFVSGGVPPYGDWRAANENLGTIDPDTGVYTIDPFNTTSVGINMVYITDSLGQTADATVQTKFKE